MKPPDFPFRSIERHGKTLPRGPFRRVIFDFDGTLSLVRGGWAGVMAGCFLEWIPLRPGESAAELGEELRREALQLNGQQTIFQMARFAARVRERGATPREPEWYKARFTEVLLLTTAERLSALRDDRAGIEQYLVRGAVELLRTLQAEGAALYLVSGTEKKFVHEEAEALGLREFFGDRIYGPDGDDRNFSKMQVMSEIIGREPGLRGELLAFGDGPVEIQNTKQFGGLAVGIASDETRPGSAGTDPVKRQLLLEAGADLIAPDYQEIPALLVWLRDTLPQPL
jgi:phosphoglycolate phosphatase